MTKNKIENGDKVKDVVTGFTGVVTAITAYLTGCDQMTVNPGLDKEGVPQEQYSFDENRLKIIKKKSVTLIGKDEPKASRKKGADFNAGMIKRG